LIDKLHIDVFSLFLSHLTLISFMFQLSKVFTRIEDARLRADLNNLLLNYSGALGAGDWIVWPILLTAIYPFYSLLFLSVKKKLWLLLQTFFTDRQLVRITAAMFIIWLTTTLFALLHWFFAYVIAFVLGLGLYVRESRIEKKERGA
jgi:hypothetical protein